MGAILLMIALMVAMQAEIEWRRAQRLGARASDRGPQVPAGADGG